WILEERRESLARGMGQRQRGSLAGAFEVAAGAGVYLEDVAGVDEEGYVDADAGLEFGGLGAALGGIATHPGVGLRDSELDGGGRRSGAQPRSPGIAGHRFRLSSLCGGRRFRSSGCPFVEFVWRPRHPAPPHIKGKIGGTPPEPPVKRGSPPRTLAGRARVCA